MVSGLHRKYLDYISHPTKAWDRIKWNALLAGCYEEIFVMGAYSWLFERLKPKSTVVDIGANIGDTTLYFAMSPNAKRIVAYEPNPETYRIAREMIGKSPYKGKIKIENSAIADRSGAKKVAKVNSGDKEFSYKDAEGGGGTSIEAITLNDALKNLTKVAIKCDCEGAEATLFDSADLSNVYAIQLEYHYCREKVAETLKKKGFRVTSWDEKDGVGYIGAYR